MKHDGSTRGHSTERRKCRRIFFSAWSPDLGLHNDSLASLGQRERCSEQMESNGGRMAEDGERGIFRLVKRFNSLHWVITP